MKHSVGLALRTLTKPLERVQIAYSNSKFLWVGIF